MKLIVPLLGFALSASMAYADGVYTCANAVGESVIMKMTADGQRMSLRSLYHEVNFTLSKSRPTDLRLVDYFYFSGHYPTEVGRARAVVAVPSSLMSGDTSKENLGAIRFDGLNYRCKVGEGKLTVAGGTNSPRRRREPCRLTTHYDGLTYFPPRVVCNYGDGIISITSTGRP